MYRDAILTKANAIKDELIAIRRDIHANPEIGLEEIRTSGIVEQKLRGLGLEVKTGIGITGVIGTLYGSHPGKTLLLRADMDCLKMTELNEAPYKSKREGFMHACGHDAHTTWLLGAAMILSELKGNLHGNVKFLFQPAEETDGGAERMILAGAMENPTVDAVIGAHVWPLYDSGKIAIKTGPMMAAPDMFKLKIYGKGGHGAEPHRSIDPIAIGCQVYMGLQTIVSRKVDPIDSVVLSVTTFHGGSAHNVIPDHVEMEGSVRTLTKELRKKVPELMDQIIKGITEAHGGRYELEYIPYYPPVINDAVITDVIEAAGLHILGDGNVERMPAPTMGSEDFSYFQEHVPGSFFIVGTRNPEKGITALLHNPYFDIDEDILHLSAAVLAQSAMVFLDPSK